VRVTVADTGPGIPAERVAEIFEPFVTSKPQRLGLGLAICRSIVSAHDGALSVERAHEGGASFSFTVPGTIPTVSAVAAYQPGRRGTRPSG
jgi:signal transduction histidine kinase